jgi:predicted nucleic acid-binding protein
VPETFVVDCSVAAKWILPEPGRTAALAWFDRYSAGEVWLIAPDLLLAEFASLVVKGHRRKRITAPQALEAFSLMTKCAPRLYDIQPRLPRALDLSLRYQLSLWDSLYLTLALEFDCSLITADLRLYRALKGRHPFVQRLT